MSKELYAQCALERRDKGDVIRMVSWIKASHKQGSRVRDEDGVIWTVKERGHDPLPEDVVKSNSRDYRHHRETTDI